MTLNKLSEADRANIRTATNARAGRLTDPFGRDASNPRNAGPVPRAVPDVDTMTAAPTHADRWLTVEAFWNGRAIAGSAIRLKGAWLQRAGFQEGDSVAVEIAGDTITLRRRAQ